ncbi:glycosyltransferase family 2 protein [Aurantiacibacter marinus]|uniref:Glycosyltransferase 2-like domain-containing protein n=1 Tax=Aurantiacibacter marinus TaxID=874156 RepID=A0A0H0XVQ7_9SPHN|nr:glycosyltransferase family A protein [Aurantiacibacter marinus]KLI64355.1 hypothetical protein AAV99_01650 [Aurantiacibacter marinus]
MIYDAAQNRPTFSVIVPVYNAAETIEDTIASIRSQSLEDLELILVDDGSSDDSLLKMLRLAGSDPRVRLVAQPNGGVSAARNRGAAIAQGGLLAFCDSDDLWHAEKLAAHHAYHLANPALSGSYAQIAFVERHCSASHQKRTLSSVPDGDLTLAQIIGENPVCTTSNLVVTRAAFERIGGFAEGMNYAEDQEWLARAVTQGESISGIDELLVGYRLSPGGLSVNLEQMYAGWRELTGLYGADQDTAAAEAIYCRYLARRALRGGNPPADARRYALRGLSLNPSAFLSDMRRGGATLIAAFAAGAMPSSMRLRLFA